MVQQRNREILTKGKRYIQNKAKKHLVNEVVFDKDARKEYLTGFHKRKLQRQKKAQEFHKEQERLTKIQERKEMRDERKMDLENRLNEFKSTMEEISAINNEENEEEDEDEEWNGFDENKKESESIEEPKLKGILHHTEIYHKDNNNANNDFNDNFNSNDVIINDETTVTIESLDNPNQPKLITIDDIAKANNVNLNKSNQILENSIEKAKNYAVLCGVSKPEPKRRKNLDIYQKLNEEKIQERKRTNQNQEVKDKNQSINR